MNETGRASVDADRSAPPGATENRTMYNKKGETRQSLSLEVGVL